MSLTFVSGDPQLTQAQVLAFGYNTRGRAEVTPLATALLTAYPAAFASYAKQCRNDRIKAGTPWLWYDAQPVLCFLPIRESSVGITRLRYVESVLLILARDYRLYSIRSIAFAPLLDGVEWAAFKPVFDQWLRPSQLPAVVYERYIPGVRADESLPDNRA